MYSTVVHRRLSTISSGLDFELSYLALLLFTTNPTLTAVYERVIGQNRSIYIAAHENAAYFAGTVTLPVTCDPFSANKPSRCCCFDFVIPPKR